MNQLTHTAKIAGQWQTADRPSLKLPLYVRLGLVVFVVTVIVVVGQIFQLRLTTQLSDPFMGYEAILPGQPRNAEITSEYSCPFQNTPSGTREYCTRAPADGPFSLITVTLWDGIINRADFVVVEARLTAGDLTALWGEPVVQLYGTSANFEWPDAGVKARGRAATGKFSYFIPLHQVSLSGLPEE
jgi:hypothetical protein